MTSANTRDLCKHEASQVSGWRLASARRKWTPHEPVWTFAAPIALPRPDGAPSRPASSIDVEPGEQRFPKPSAIVAAFGDDLDVLQNRHGAGVSTGSMCAR